MSHAKIALYFYGSMSEVYQVEQWLRVFEALHQEQPMEIVTRDRLVYIHLSSITDIHIAYRYTQEELLTYYAQKNFRVILYVNNGAKNFQSLSYARSLHVHLNHGESEKASMHSNQIKSYDYTFVVGEAALDRYHRHLIHIERAHFVPVGRPQFDHIIPPKKPTGKQVILYAPTDESTHISMRYTSLKAYGLTIVETILAHPDHYLIYRPHPRTGTHDQEIRQIDLTIRNMIEQAPNAVVETELPAIDLLSIVDLGIFDNSSVIIDFLYFDKPMFLTDMFLPEYHDTSSLKMIEACIRLDENNIGNLSEMIEKELSEDTFADQRREIRRYYLGDYRPGESTSLFRRKIREISQECEQLLEEKNPTQKATNEH